ncbi:MAG: hypothetical protein ACO3FL_04470 [Ilumatobacteraceae bacterium]
MRLLGIFFSSLLIGCGGFDDPRRPTLSEENKQAIASKAADTARWATWCDGYPSAEQCNDGDAMAGILGFGCAVGFEPSCEAVSRSVKDGQLYRSPNRNDSDNTASRDQYFGFMAAQLNGENRWLDVKRFLKRHGKICHDATDTRCNLTPVVWALTGAIHSHLGYQRDASMLINTILWDKLLFIQAGTVPLGYQLNLVAEASWLAYQLGVETEHSYAAGVMAYARQPANPWFCIVALGPDDRCVELAFNIWPNEPAIKNQWSISRDMLEEAWTQSQGWEFLFIAALFGLDLNSLEYSGKLYSKDSLRPR